MLYALMPKVVVIAGPNGAGKSTAATAVLRNTLQVNAFVNADTIAAGLSAFSPDTVAIAAGRIMLGRIRELASEGRDFAFETSLGLLSGFAVVVTRLLRIWSGGGMSGVC
jgi:predicted ABC-type ATPase